MKGLFVFSVCLKCEFLKNIEVQEVVMEVQEESLILLAYLNWAFNTFLRHLFLNRKDTKTLLHFTPPYFEVSFP